MISGRFVHMFVGQRRECCRLTELGTGVCCIHVTHSCVLYLVPQEAQEYFVHQVRSRRSNEYLSHLLLFCARLYMESDPAYTTHLLDVIILSQESGERKPNVPELCRKVGLKVSSNVCRTALLDVPVIYAGAYKWHMVLQ